MKQSFQKALHFDRFTLDLARGFLRDGDRDVDLRPKAFQVLCHLASNAGRLVSKQELLEAVWPAVSVSDDSLVQCIRELRDKMGDDNHCLIRTVHRRGYLLDVQITDPAQRALEDPATPRKPPPNQVAPNIGVRRGAARFSVTTKWRQCLVGAGLCAVLLIVLYQKLWPPPGGIGSSRVDVIQAAPAVPRLSVENVAFTAADTRRISELAQKKQLPLPAFRIEQAATDVRDADRRFVGVWMSEAGWLGSFRQMMLIVTSVDANGIADGYAANGPPQTRSHVQSPSRYWPLKMRISGDSIFFRDAMGEFEGTLTQQNKIALKVTFSDRNKTGWVLLEPVWTQVRAAHSNFVPISR